MFVDIFILILELLCFYSRSACAAVVSISIKQINEQGCIICVWMEVSVSVYANQLVVCVSGMWCQCQPVRNSFAWFAQSVRDILFCTHRIRFELLTYTSYTCFHILSIYNVIILMLVCICMYIKQRQALNLQHTFIK